MLLQSEAAECGIACLAMIATFHGHALDLNDARHRFRISLKGTTLRNLVTFGRSIGLAPRALRLEPEGLERLQCPAILHVDMNHFVVLKEMRGKRAIIHDPAFGVRTFSADDINRRFTGIALELAPGTDFRRSDPAPRLRLSALLGPMPQFRPVLARTLVLSVGSQLLVLAAPFYVQLVIDRAVSQGDGGVLLLLAFGFGLVTLLRAAAAWVRARALLALGGLFNARFVANLVHRMLALPHSWFESRHVSALLSRLNSTQPIKDLITEGLAAVVVDGFMALLTILAGLLFAPSLAALVLGAFAISCLLKWWQIANALHHEQQYVEAFAKSQHEFIETVRGIAPVKLFRKEADRENRWGDRHVDAINARYFADWVKARSDLAQDAGRALTLGAVVYLGATQVIAGTLSLGMLTAFITYQQMFADSSTKLLDFAGRLRLLDVHVQRLADVIEGEPEAGSAEPIAGEGHRLVGALSVRDLEFRYGALEEPVLTGISFDVAAGEFVAITGPSGGGKTTLLKLLLGLLEPGNGKVLYDGQPLAQIGLSTVRDQIGVVMQDDVLLSGSIAQNITFFDLAADIQQAEECARMAALHEDIARLPMGYNTMVGDMGTVLSGGQRQRLLLARALYRRPRILFVDEGTSNLDVARETEVNAHLRGLAITRLVIAHRRDTIDAADRILELSQDGIRERTLD